MLLAETHEGYHNLIKLVSAGYTEGFYYKPRIDKELLAQHAKGLIGLSSCLKGEVAEGLSHQQERKAIEAAGAYRDILGPDNFFLEMQWHGIEEQRIVNSGLPAIARDLGLPLVCTNDVHYLRETDAHPHDVLLCIGTGKAFSDPKRLRYDAQAVLPEDAGGDGGGRSRTFPDALAQHGAHRRALQRHARRGRELPAELRRAAPASRSTTTSSTSCAKGSRSGCRGCSSWRRRARCATPSTSTSGGSRTRSTMIKQMKYPGTS